MADTGFEPRDFLALPLQHGKFYVNDDGVVWTHGFFPCSETVPYFYSNLIVDVDVLVHETSKVWRKPDISIEAHPEYSFMAEDFRVACLVTGFRTAGNPCDVAGLTLCNTSFMMVHNNNPLAEDKKRAFFECLGCDVGFYDEESVWIEGRRITLDFPMSTVFYRNDGVLPSLRSFRFLHEWEI